jgi:CheY-like chemotaxis protein
LLLADDSVTIQRVIELTFADEDVHVIAVGDGKQAIDRVQQERPDIVLADIGMPERDGYEVASFIKGNPQLAHIPVLLLTGAFEPIDETRARAVGCDGVLVKPFEPQMVINRVRDLLAGRRPSGLWTTNAPPQTPLRPAAAAPNDVELRQPAAGPKGAGTSTASLEEYFDRLDAAFGSTPEAAAAPASTPPVPAPPPVQASAPAPVPVSSAPPQQHDYGYREPAPAAGGPPPPPPVNVADWDPQLPGDTAAVPTPASARLVDASSTGSPTPAVAAAPAAPVSEAAAPQAAPQPSASAVPVAAAQPVPAAVPQMPPLADAFAALLAAEQGQPIVPSAPRASSLADDQIDDIVKRVIDRMGNESMRRAVLDTAERLVREEIDRIKGR